MAVSQAHFASASLYVGDLHRDVTEAMLYEVFNSVGPVASIRVCRDSSTRRSLGYAYVNYHSVADAERALDTLNYTHIKNVPCRIMWSHRDPSLRKSGAGNIFVKNLDKDIDNKALYDTFSLFGNILSCKVAQDEFGKSRGFGFVHYENEEAAQTAIERVNTMKIGNKTVYVGPFKKRSERSSQMQDKYTNVYVKNIPLEWDEEKITNLFSEHGEVTSVALQTDGRGRKFGFVNFNDAEAAKTAVENLNQKKVAENGEKSERSGDGRKAEGEGSDERRTKEEEKEDGDRSTTTGTEGDRAAGAAPADETGSNTSGEGGPDEDISRLYVSRFQPRAERVAMLRNKFDQSAEQRQKKSHGVNLYIKNLNDTIDDTALRNLFEPFGTITSAKVMLDELGVSRGFGFVSFLSPDEATKAVTEMHLNLVEGKPLYVGLHEKRDDRIQRLQQKMRVPMRPRMPAGMPPQIQFGAQQMYYGVSAGMQQPGGHIGFPPGGNRAAPGGGGYPPAGGMVPWSRGGPPPQAMRGFGRTRDMPPGDPAMWAAAGAGGMGAMPNMAPPGSGPVLSGGGVPMPVNSEMGAVQKQVLGERLFPLIQRIQPKLAGKITGMMLDMDNHELLQLLDSEAQLKAKVDEALMVLHNSGLEVQNDGLGL